VKSFGPVLLTLCVSVSAATLPPEIREVFSKAQCQGCHNDNGVASSTRLKFPAEEADEPAFIRSLESLINRAQPAQSRLIQMPTARLAHPGGERIKRGSADETAVLGWIAKLPAASATAIDAPRARQTVLRRLTHSQYNQTIADLLGDQTQPARQFPTEDFVQGFTNSAEGQSISPLLVGAYAQAAARLARNAARAGKLPVCKTPVCVTGFVRTFGKSAFRRPLTDVEVARFTKLGDPQLVVEAMLQSPDFLFRSEPGAYGAASRLSYLIWNTLPDRELTRLADAGLLRADRQIEASARRMLTDPRARLALDEFAGQWLRFDRVRNAIRERRLFPEFGTELAAAMTEETSRLFQHLVWNNQDFREFFRADYTFVNSSLAQLYGLAPPEREFSRVDWPAGSKRAGVLGHASFFTMTSKPEETSPTERGLFVREHFLCQIVPPPPAGVNTTLPAVMEDKPMSNRDRLAIHLSNPSCAACHRLVDPIGFGLEQFDAIGRFREKQVALVFPTIDKRRNQGTRREGVPVQIPVDTTASIVGIPNSNFTTAAEAGRILAESPVCQRCVVKQYFRYAMNRPESAADQPAIDAIFDRFRRSGFKFQELILGVVTSGPFLEEFAHAK